MFGALASFSVWLLVVITKPDGRIAGLVWMAAGISMYVLYRKKKRLVFTGSLQMEEIKIPEYKAMHIKHILVTARSSGGTEALQTALQLAAHHHAKITAVYILEVPESSPLEMEIENQVRRGELALKRAEAVAREYNTNIELEFVRSRSVKKALFELMRRGDFDLAVVSASKKDFREGNGFAKDADVFLKSAPCRVIFCKD